MTIDTTHRFESSPLARNVFEPTAKADTDSWIGVVADVVRFAGIIADTDFVPAGLRGSAPATAAAILYGREVGLPPMTSLSSTHVVDGRPAISAEAMRALVLAAGHEIAFDVQSGAECTMRGRRRNSDAWTSVTWTLSMARSAGLVNRQNWQRYPRAMLAARATAELCRLIFPDVIHGFTAVEESDAYADAAGSPQTAAQSPDDQSPAARPVRRRGGRVASSGRGSRPVADPVPRPGEPAISSGVPLPGEPGFEDPSSSALTTDDDADGPDETRSVEPSPGDADSRASASPTYRDDDPVVDDPAEPGSDTSHDTPPAPGSAATLPGMPEVVGDDDRPPIAPRTISRAQQRMMFALFADLGFDRREDRLDVSATIVGRKLESSDELSAYEASQIIDTVARAGTADDLAEILAPFVAEAGEPDDAD